MITIRDAIPEDASALMKGEKKISETPGFLASRPHELTEESFRQKIESLAQKQNGKYIVAEEKGRILAHAFLDPMGLAAVEHIVRLTIAVHPGNQEKGIGEKLMTHLIAWAKAEPSVEKIELHVRAVNLRAIRLYKKLGFHIESRLRKRIKFSDGKYSDDFEMGLFVKPAPESLTVISLAIGKVVSSRREAIDDDWDQVKNHIELDSTQFSTEVLAGLKEFSHLEVIFHMNQVDLGKVETGARHPRGNAEWPKVGIFAQRGKNRPNQIGVSVCRILKIAGLKIELEGLDAVDGTPVLDIKPWVKEFGPRGEVKQPAWMDELMKKYWRNS
jgi:tRNA-Thr(GGU) m(6)t(6)A37 methyltransferase TsaA